MNCKQGDLAVIVRSDFPENVGAIVEVLRLNYELRHLGDLWHVRSAGRLLRTGFIYFDGRHSGQTDLSTESCIDDNRLRPLRESDGTDEVLRIAGHPLSQSHREKVGA